MSISRVSTAQLNKNFAVQINNTQAKYNKLAEQIASGVKISSMSDDVVSAKSILKATKELNNIEMYKSNLEQADIRLTETDSILNSVNSQMQEAYDLSLYVANGTMGPEQIAAYQEQLDAIIDNVIRLANTKYGDEYLFAGSMTTTTPYVLNSTDDSTDANAGMVYRGNSGTKSVVVADGKTQQVNFNGAELFGSANFTTDTTTGEITILSASGAIGALYEIKAAIQDAASIDTAALKTGMGDLQTGITNVTAKRTKLGAISNEMDNMLDSYATDTLNLTQLRSNLQDTDLPSAISDWYSVYQSLQASYSMMSQTMSNASLLNYI